MIQKFRKKPVVIEAMLWDGTFQGTIKIREWSGCPFIEVLGSELHPIGMKIPTLEGEIRANLGDWIIRGVKGEIYPCKPDIFKETYEPANPHRWFWRIGFLVGRKTMAHAYEWGTVVEFAACGASLAADSRESMAGDELCGKCRDLTGDRPDMDELKREQKNLT